MTDEDYKNLVIFYTIILSETISRAVCEHNKNIEDESNEK